MVSQERIDNTHSQIYDTCLLSNFAVVGNYFISERIEDFFKNYYIEFESFFRKHGITFIWPEFGFCQSKHINYYAHQSNISGYDVLLKLFLQSKQTIFKKCKSNFDAEKISLKNGLITNGTFVNESINDFLRNSKIESIINVFINKNDGVSNNHPFDKFHMHSLTIYYNKNFYCHDTINPLDDIILPENWWEYNRIGDILIYWKQQIQGI